MTQCSFYVALARMCCKHQSNEVTVHVCHFGLIKTVNKIMECNLMKFSHILLIYLQHTEKRTYTWT